MNFVTMVMNGPPLGAVIPNVGGMLARCRKRFRGREAYREKRAGEYRSLDWDSLYERVALTGSGLIKTGLRRGEVVAMLSRNREELMVLELAAMSVGATACPIFSEYPVPQLEYILGHSRAKLLLVSGDDRLREVLKTRARRRLEAIYAIDPVLGGRGGARPISDLEALGRAAGTRPYERRRKRVGPDDPCLLMYTSGTTGKPKGVLLSHRNVLSQRKALDILWKLKPGGRFLSYLPWHHSFGGIFELFTALHTGATLTLDESYGKDIPLLIENFKRVRPTVYFSVPRIHQALVEEARRSKAAESAIFHPGLRFVFTAAAALPAHISDYFEKKGIPVIEGWGLTETSPCLTLTTGKGKRSPGTVGFPIPGVAIKISKEGEIVVKGPNVMLGYHRDPARTKRALTPGGWFRTGDYGSLSEKGLTLTCRKDGMFKLTNGEIVISQRVENALVANPLIQHAVAVGSGRDFVAALVFPNAGLAGTGPAARRKIAEAVRGALELIPEKYARPRAFALIDRPLTLQDGELTPTMKVVATKVLENCSGFVAALYGDSARAESKSVVRL